MDTLISNWLAKLANENVFYKMFIKVNLDTKPSKAASSIGGSVPINSKHWSYLGVDLFEDNQVIKFNGELRKAYPNSNLGEVGRRSFKLGFPRLDGRKCWPMNQGPSLST